MELWSLLTKLYLAWSVGWSEHSQKESTSCPATQPKLGEKVPYTVIVEGNVGSGKSTFVDILARDDDRIAAVPEPVAAWQNVSGTGTDILKLMFDDGKRFSGVFQQVSTLSRLQAALNIDRDKPVRIMERSIFSERYCFLENQRRTGQLSPVEFALMDKWFQLISLRFWKQVKPDLIVYLRTDVPTLDGHINKRARSEEDHMDPEFLLGLQKYHEDWLYYRNSSFPLPGPVLTLDANLSLEDFTQQVLEHKNQIIPKDILL